MRWTIVIWISVAALGLIFSVRLDVHEKLQVTREAKRARDVELERASCMMKNMSNGQKALMATVVASKHLAAETDGMWSSLVRVGLICHVDREDIVSRLEWPAMFDQLATVDDFYRQALRLRGSSGANTP